MTPLRSVVTPVRATVALCVVIVAIMGGLVVYSIVRPPPALNDEALRQMDVFVWPEPRPIAPFHLTTAEGQPFTLEDLRGAWSFLFFGFTHCPDVCPTTMSTLATARQRVARLYPEALPDFRAVMVTVDPERDDAQTLARYVHAFSPAFVGVRGDRAAIAGLAGQVNVTFGKMPAEGGGYDVEHSTSIVIVDPDGEYHGFAKNGDDAATIVLAFLSLRQRWQ